ncbi:MAG: dephospho-CoA kinase [Fibrobacterota bacterium]
MKLGLVGGIASGKSTAAAILRERGWEVVDADKVAHDVYAPGTRIVDEIREAFGAGVVLPDGSVDRKALGAIVFGNPEALQRLEALVHPATRVLIARRMDEAMARSGRVVLEMTLLHRWPDMAAKLDRVLGIRCPDEIRLQRLMTRNDLTREAAQSRLDSQAPQEQILSPATKVVDNVGTVDEFVERMKKWFSTEFT